MRVFLYIIRNEHKQKLISPGFPGKYISTLVISIPETVPKIGG